MNLMSYIYLDVSDLIVSLKSILRHCFTIIFNKIFHIDVSIKLLIQFCLKKY